MTNLEKYMNKIINICNQDSTEVAVAMDIGTGVLRRCSEVGCERCKFSSRFNGNGRCEVNLVRWLFSEYQEPVPKLNSIERGLCQAVKSGFIARDKDEILCLYKTKPFQNDSGWSLGVAGYWIEIDENLFQFITWESGKAWSIKDLLKLEVEE